MLSQAVAKRYARAVASALPPSVKLDRIAGELAQVAGLIEGHSDLGEVFLNPGFRLPERDAVLVALLKKLGAGDLTQNFLRLMLENGRIDHLPLVVELLNKIVDEREGRVRGELVVAAPLGKAGTEQIAESLGKVVGKKVLLEETVDASLIGGAVARVGGLVFDASLRQQLDELRRQLAARN